MLQLNAFLTTVYPVIEWETVINGLYGPFEGEVYGSMGRARAGRRHGKGQRLKAGNEKR